MTSLIDVYSPMILVNRKKKKWLEGDKVMKTCMDCVFACVAADNQPCERFKDASLFGKEDKVQKGNKVDENNSN